MRPTVTTAKHYVQQSIFAVASGAIVNTVMASGVTVALANLQNEVREGCKISAIYCEYWVTSDDATQGSSIITIEKKSSNQPTMTAAESALLFTYPNKKNVLKTFMGLNNSNVGVAQPIIREWIKIPKSKQRFGLDDQIVVNFHGQSNGLSVCGFTLYKEQY